MSSIFGRLLLASTASALILETGGRQMIQLASQTPSLSHLVFPLSNVNDSTLLLNESIAALHAGSNDYRFVCNGNQYGYIPDLDIQDCMGALGVIKPGRTRIKFAERHTPEKIGDVFPLPWRWMGSTLIITSPSLSRLRPDLVHASCYLQIALQPGARTGENSLDKLREAAYALITQCAVRNNQGGVVTRVGGL